MAWCTYSNLEASYRLHISDLVKSGIAEYNTSYEETVEGLEEIIVTHHLHLICYNKTRFQLNQKCDRTNTNIDRTLRASEGNTDEVFQVGMSATSLLLLYPKPQGRHYHACSSSGTSASSGQGSGAPHRWFPCCPRLKLLQEQW